jgi:GMP synthase-like glutamine amidotransferase
MHIHWLQHANHEGLGCIAPWLEANGHSYSGTRLQAGEKPPGVETFDALVLMGGPMNIYQHEQYPWLAEEKALIRVALDAGRRVLGICLGAQLLAEVLGTPGEANVVRNAETELGFFPVTRTAAGRQHPLLAGLPDSFTAFHWHGDTYRLPADAVNLATSAACAQQAFAWDGRRVLGLQFHLEVTPADAQEWFREMPTEQGPFVQSPAAILADTAAFAANNRRMASICEAFFGSLR